MTQLPKPSAVAYSEEAERAVLGCVIVEPLKVIDDVSSALSKSDFFVPAYREIFGAIRDMQSAHQPIDVMTLHQWLVDRKLAEEVGSPGVLTEMLVDHTTHLNVRGYIDIVKEKSNRRKAQAWYAKLGSDIDQTDDLGKTIEGAIEDLRSFKGDVGKDDVAGLLQQRLFDITKEPVRTLPVLSVGGVGIAKPGDLVAISAQVKSGKSALVGAMMAALISARGDYLGLSGYNPERKAVVHFDTEQSPEDHYDLIARTLARAGLPGGSPELYSYCLTDFSIKQRRAALDLELRRRSAGVAAFILDGIADLVVDPNDSAECFDLIAWVYTLAIQYKTSVVCVLHENPGSEYGKTRGHLGSQLERKAATNLRLVKDSDGVIQYYDEKARRGLIAKDSGPHFKWDDTKKMHVTCASSRERKEQGRSGIRFEELKRLALEVFSESPSYRYGQLCKAIQKMTTKSERTSERIADAMRDQGLLDYSSGMHIYSLKAEHNR